MAAGPIPEGLFMGSTLKPVAGVGSRLVSSELPPPVSELLDDPEDAGLPGAPTFERGDGDDGLDLLSSATELPPHFCGSIPHSRRDAAAPERLRP
jgi:hypothetical protein